MTEHEHAYWEGFLQGMNLSAAIQDACGSVSGMEERFRNGMTIDEFMVKFAKSNGIVQTENGKYKFIDPE